jgi:hypothetical protein
MLVVCCLCSLSSLVLLVVEEQQPELNFGCLQSDFPRRLSSWGVSDLACGLLQVEAGLILELPNQKACVF